MCWSFRRLGFSLPELDWDTLVPCWVVTDISPLLPRECWLAGPGRCFLRGFILLTVSAGHQVHGEGEGTRDGASGIEGLVVSWVSNLSHPYQFQLHQARWPSGVRQAAGALGPWSLWSPAPLPELAGPGCSHSQGSHSAAPGHLPRG